MEVFGVGQSSNYCWRIFQQTRFNYQRVLTKKNTREETIGTGANQKDWPFFLAADNQELLDVYLAPLSKAGLPPLALQEDEEAGLGISGRPVGWSIFLHLLGGVLLWQTHLTKMGCWKNNMLIQAITMRYWGFLPIWGTELTRIQHLGNKLVVLFKQQNKG